MNRLLTWVGFAALAGLTLVLVTDAVFWFTIPPTPALPDDFAPPAPDSTVSKPDLRAELLGMRQLDQAVRDS